MKRYLFAGLIILLPFAVTLFVLIYLLEFLTAPFVGWMRSLLELLPIGYEPITNHETILLFIARLGVLAILFAFTLALGYLGRKYFFKSFIAFTNAIFLRLPLIRSVFRVSKEITTHLFEENRRSFNTSVLAPFPHDKALALGFETGPPPREAIDKTGAHDQALRSVFIPTSPHPLSGFVLIMPKKETKEVGLTVEEVLKVLVSCGLYDPSTQEKPPISER